jgi:Xaa-Pro aminopeptidase
MFSAEYAKRRARVLEAIAPGVLVLPAAPVAIRNNDVEHAHRQASDLHYLTGFDEPDAVAVLRPGAEAPFSLFVRERNPEREIWDGPREGLEGARERFGADAAFPITELDVKLPDCLENETRLFYHLGEDPAFDARVIRALGVARTRARKGSSYPLEIIDSARVLHEMRRLKSALEVEAMERAVAITQAGHVAAMREAAPGRHEYELEAILHAEFRRRGAKRVAYDSIVGSGPNATILHYHQNDRRMEAGDLVLIDAGAEWRYYAADVTRTFPVSGRFSEVQRRVYQAVLDAQLASIALVAPGRTLDEVHRASVEVLTDALIGWGVIDGPRDDAIEAERYKPYYMHKTSHYLGMDVHDVGAYFEAGKHRPLEPGVVVTVEPGLYFAPALEGAAAELAGIGVRIEDDVLVTEGGCRVLSEGVPKTVADVEQACRG